ncbi:LysR family transcriptional regulator [Companilactobacillus sp.]|uniref:LysR family transcriptional regulator n=1 Tax=Companilactobacillus sp. TaxID=2767905 RepID=UPI00262CD6D9|nr:LysR family transcriptional regulator [Companilactobacillus sp.]
MFQQMQYFISIVKNHSFTQAAFECNISQSAISQQMKELESNLGIKLLQRKGRSFVVTEAGKYFYTHSQDIIEDVNQLVTNTVNFEKSDNVELKVGYLRSFGTTEFLQTVSQFSKQFPKVKIKISSGDHEQLFDLLKNNQIDLNFSDQRRALSNEYHNEFLTESKFMAAVSSTVFSDFDQEIDVSDLMDIPCILISENGQAETDQAYFRDVLGIKSEFVIAKNYDEAQIMIASNQGFLIVNNRMQNQINTDIVKTLYLKNGQQQMIQKYYAYWKADNSGYYIESFAELLRDSFA